MSKADAKHYDFPNGVRTFDITQHLDFCSGNVVKYVCRAGKKNGESSLDDLKKAVWYLNQLVEKAELDVTETERENVGIVDAIHLCPPSLWASTSSWTD
jgi:hypothetical protein